MAIPQFPYPTLLSLSGSHRSIRVSRTHRALARPEVRFSRPRLPPHTIRRLVLHWFHVCAQIRAEILTRRKDCRTFSKSSQFLEWRRHVHPAVSRLRAHDPGAHRLPESLALKSARVPWKTLKVLTNREAFSALGYLGARRVTAMATATADWLPQACPPTMCLPRCAAWQQSPGQLASGLGQQQIRQS